MKKLGKQIAALSLSAILTLTSGVTSVSFAGEPSLPNETAVTTEAAEASKTTETTETAAAAKEGSTEKTSETAETGKAETATETGATTETAPATEKNGTEAAATTETQAAESTSETAQSESKAESETAQSESGTESDTAKSAEESATEKADEKAWRYPVATVAVTPSNSNVDVNQVAVDDQGKIKENTTVDGKLTLTFSEEQIAGSLITQLESYKDDHVHSIDINGYALSYLVTLPEGFSVTGTSSTYAPAGLFSLGNSTSSDNTATFPINLIANDEDNDHSVTYCDVLYNHYNKDGLITLTVSYSGTAKKGTDPSSYVASTRGSTSYPFGSWMSIDVSATDASAQLLKPEKKEFKIDPVDETIRLGGDMLVKSPSDTAFNTEHDSVFVVNAGDKVDMKGTYRVDKIQTAMNDITKMFQTAQQNVDLKDIILEGLDSEFTVKINPPAGLTFPNNWTLTETSAFEIPKDGVTYGKDGSISVRMKLKTDNIKTYQDLSNAITNLEQTSPVLVLNVSGVEVSKELNDNTALTVSSTVDGYMSTKAKMGEDGYANKINYKWTWIQDKNIPDGGDGTDAVLAGSASEIIQLTLLARKTSVKVSKIWDDANDKDGIRPSSITVDLLADGEKVKSQEMKPDASGNWADITFEDLPVYKNGKTITYTVAEEKVADGYTASVSGDAASGFTITNKHALTVKIGKVDSADTSKTLSGATLAVLKADGTVADQWTSDGTAHTVYDLDADKVYTIRELSAPKGYKVAADSTFTIDKDGKVTTSAKTAADGTILITDEKRAEGTGKVNVTKVTLKEDHPYSVTDQTFYTALFSDKAFTSRVSDVKEIHLKGTYTQTVTFDGLPYGTYYVAEVTATGAVRTTDQQVTKIEVNGGTARLDKSHKTAEATIINTIGSGVEGEARKVSLTVKKVVKDHDGKAAKVNATFYFGLFLDKDLEQPAEDVDIQKVTLKDASEGKVTFSNLPYTQKYYVAEVDKDGNPVVDDDDFAYTVSYSANGIEYGKINKTKVTATNTQKSVETEKPKETETEKPAAVKTGDSSPLAPLTALMVIAACAAIAIIVFRRKKNAQ